MRYPRNSYRHHSLCILVFSLLLVSNSQGSRKRLLTFRSRRGLWPLGRPASGPPLTYNVRFSMQPVEEKKDVLVHGQLSDHEKWWKRKPLEKRVWPWGFSTYIWYLSVSRLQARNHVKRPRSISTSKPPSTHGYSGKYSVETEYPNKHRRQMTLCIVQEVVFSNPSLKRTRLRRAAYLVR